MKTWKGSKPGSVLCVFRTSWSSVWDDCRQSPRAAVFATLRTRVMSPRFPPLVAFEPCIRWGLPSRSSLEPRWWAFTPPFHPYHSHHLRGAGGLFSVALSIGFAPVLCVVSHKAGLLAVQPLAGIMPCDARTFLTLRRDHAPFQAAGSVTYPKTCVTPLP
jgi:hypothetical protein